MAQSEVELRFSEWSILADSVRRFPDVLKKQHPMLRRKHIECYAVGNPRCAKIVMVVKINGYHFRKIIQVDIRDGSCETWLDKWFAEHYEQIEL